MRVVVLFILLFVSQEAFATESEGTVYILTNKSNAYLKIGMTSRDVEKRCKELSSATGVATEFKVYFAKKVKNYKEVEKTLHTKFTKSSVNINREFFAIKPETAYNALNEYEGLVVVERERRSNFTFSELGIEMGEKLKYKEDKRRTAEVIDDNLVMYKKEAYSLSGLTAYLEKKSSGSGIKDLNYWFYKDKLLSDLREEHAKK